MERKNYYDTIVIGAGAGGLFFGAACLAFADVLILEKTKKAGTKLLMSGSGQCNVTHGGSIKEFLSCYGANGKKIRSCLYKHNNIELRSFLQSLGVTTYEREDGKVFPVSMEAEEIRSALLSTCERNGVVIRYGEAVTGVEVLNAEKELPDAEGEMLCESTEAAARGSRLYDMQGRNVQSAATDSISNIPEQEAAGGIAAQQENTQLRPCDADADTRIGFWGVSAGTLVTDTEGIPTAAEQGFPPYARFLVHTDGGVVYACRRLVVACGGSSYPSTGSDGELLNTLLRDLPQLTATPPRPALVPVFVENYPFTELSGVSFHDVEIKIFSNGQSTAKCGSNAGAELALSAENAEASTPQMQKSDADSRKKNKKTRTELKLAKPVGDLLLTHKNFSGPVILNNSGYLQSGYGLEINFVFPYNNNDMLSRLKSDSVGNRKQISTYIAENFSLPKKFIAVVLEMINVCDRPMVQLSGKELTSIAETFAKAHFTVAGTAGFKQAMATAGGISLDSVTLSDMQSKEYPGLYFIGEVLDINGDTGGYNLQFAYSSARSVIDGIYI